MRLEQLRHHRSVDGLAVVAAGFGEQASLLPCLEATMLHHRIQYIPTNKKANYTWNHMIFQKRHMHDSIPLFRNKNSNSARCSTMSISLSSRNPLLR